MKEETLDLRQLIDIFLRNWAVIIIIPLITLTIAVGAAYKLPKKYKSTAILNIQGSYFQNPLISDLIAQVNDGSELQSQRMSLLKLAMSQKFLDDLGEKYQVYSFPRADVRRGMERESFEQSIEYISVSPTNFQISAVSEIPEDAHGITADVLQQMRHTLIEERYNNLIKTRDAIKTHVKFLSDALRQASDPHSVESISDELTKIETDLNGLLTRFSESHPEVQELRKRESELKAEVKAAPRHDELNTDSGVPADKISKEPNQQVFNELLKKLNYLTVVLDMEKDQQNVSYLGVIEQPSTPLRPFFPDKRIFAGAGFGAGILFAAILVFLAEVRRNYYISPADAAEMLDLPLLGEMPVLKASGDKFNLPPASREGSKQALPPGETIKRLPL